MNASGTLYIVPTPIGNLEDITLRALRILSEVSLIAAEDTRAAQRILSHYNLKKPCISYFEGNEAARTADLTERLSRGEDVALISEAGMPGISDPGHRLIVAAIAADLPIVVLPGPSAMVTALVGSGLPTEQFYFAGFPPRQAGPRNELFGRLRSLEATLIFYEAPSRVATTLAAMAAALGDRPACVARELSKLHEELRRGSLSELATQYTGEAPRGEVTILVGGAEGTLEMIDLEQEVRRRVEAGEGAKEIAAFLSLRTGQPRRRIYQLALVLKRDT
jgi:16S rRNA (cytidine1402-2'-O)-methyltransferase